MAKIFPGGSSVAKVFPPSLSGGGSPEPEGGRFVQKKLIDFTQENNHNFKTGGNFTDSAGFTWVVGETITGDSTSNIVCGTSGSNDGISDFFQIVNGTGLKVQTTKDNWSGAQFPKLMIEPSACMEDYDIRDRLFVCAELDLSATVTAGTLTDYWQLQVLNSDNSKYSGARMWVYNASHDLWTSVINGGTSYGAIAKSSRPSQIAIDRSHYETWGYMASLAEFPTSPAGMTGMAKITQSNAKNVTNFSDDLFAAASDKIRFDFYTNNSSTQATFVIKKLGIYRYE